MRPERRFKPGMDGGLTAAVLVSPPHHLRTAEILSKRWGPPQNMFRRYDIQDGRDIRQAAEIIEKRLAEERAISTISSTMTAQRQNPTAAQKNRKRFN
jgi:hypothetical protein